MTEELTFKVTIGFAPTDKASSAEVAWFKENEEVLHKVFAQKCGEKIIDLLRMEFQAAGYDKVKQ